MVWQVRLGSVGPTLENLCVSGYASSSTKEIFRNYLSDNTFLIIKDFTGVLEECRFTNNYCLIIDGYTFPALPEQQQQTSFRPDFCLGTDDFRTPGELVAKVNKILESGGYLTARDQSFSQTIFLMKYYHQEQSV